MVGTEEDTWTPFVDWDTVPTEVFWEGVGVGHQGRKLLIIGDQY